MLQDQNFYNKPVRSLQTMLRSLAHTDENYRNVIPDGVYGPETTSAVSTFQRNHALPVTGIVNHETWEHIVAAYNISLIDTDPAWPIITDIAVGEVFCKGDRHPTNSFINHSNLLTESIVIGRNGQKTVLARLKFFCEDFGRLFIFI